MKAKLLLSAFNVHQSTAGGVVEVIRFFKYLTVMT